MSRMSVYCLDCLDSTVLANLPELANLQNFVSKNSLPVIGIYINIIIFFKKVKLYLLSYNEFMSMQIGVLISFK